MKKLFSLILLLNYSIKAQDVTIGTQTWTTKNLNVRKFRNGEEIPFAKTVAEWNSAGQNRQPAWCYYENKEENDKTYGKLYNWYAVNDARDLAPNGQHIPTDAEWKMLTDYLGGDSIAGAKMKSTSGWEDIFDGNGSNTSGFAGLPGGSRNKEGYFYYVGGFGSWWSSSESGADNAWSRLLSYDDGRVFRGYDVVLYGYSVGCLRD